ncbi:LysR family transcriptional regulator [Propylenella binzhouense]|uniref:LysR family transcriptional regulator n=1 Tax=Propylenella binzhouense TaxID=2555902 RepID=A0A964WUU9_9HYPH|nr:LysR family transcriptional regulator [Propylenella binzhouense]MYZ49461.1 LysR family transcriptional regulator [Propylenella binzhouense]
MFHYSAMLSLRQLRCFLAVYEERSFTAASVREGATQSGMSQHVRQLEEELGVPLFERVGREVIPTATGHRYYQECVSILRHLERATQAASASGLDCPGQVRIGLLPTFTRAALAPALAAFTEMAVRTEVFITEAYSGVLTDMVRAAALDFAVVPAFRGATGLTVSRLMRDREMLVAAADGPIGGHLTPVRLAELGPLKMVLPGEGNTRRTTLESYFLTNAVAIARRIEFDAMIGTLELVAQSDWVTVLPAVLLGNDRGGERYAIRPLADPDLYSDFVVIEPARRVMSDAAQLFADLLKKEAWRIAERWRDSLAGPTAAEDAEGPAAAFADRPG